MDQSLIPNARIENQIYFIRDQKVMLDRDLALLYGVPTKVLNQAVARNSLRFPTDFMFQLHVDEFDSLRSQSVTSKPGRGGARYLPYVFTKQGIAMLSSVLQSERAILVNIQIIRTFTKLRAMIADNDNLRRKLETLEMNYDKNFKIVFDALRRLLTEEERPKPQIGFKITPTHR